MLYLEPVGQNVPIGRQIEVQNAPEVARSSKAIPLDVASLKVNKKRKAIDGGGEVPASELHPPATHKRRRFIAANTSSFHKSSVTSASSSSPPSSSFIQRSASAPDVSAALPVEADWDSMVSAPAQLPSFPPNVDSSVNNIISVSQVNACLASMGIPVTPVPDTYGSSQLIPQRGVAFPPQQTAFVSSYTPAEVADSEFVIPSNFLPVPAYDALSHSSSTSWSPSPPESTSTPAVASLPDSTFIDPCPFSVSQPPAVPASQETLQRMIEAECRARRACEEKVQALQVQLALAQAAGRAL